jgi:hypothetical protein
VTAAGVLERMSEAPAAVSELAQDEAALGEHGQTVLEGREVAGAQVLQRHAPRSAPAQPAPQEPGADPATGEPASHRRLPQITSSSDFLRDRREYGSVFLAALPVAHVLVSGRRQRDGHESDGAAAQHRVSRHRKDGAPDPG